MINYALSLADPNAHEFEVRMAIDVNPGDSVQLTLPAWIPGSYMIRDFARNLHDVRACSAGAEELPLARLDKQSWEVCAVDQQILVSYRVYAFEESVRAAYFDNTRAYFNGTSLFLRAVGHEDEPHQLQLQPGVVPEGWQVATTLLEKATDSRGFGSYQAADYFQLIDHPFEIGEHSSTGFEVQGRPHRMVFVDASDADLARVACDLAPICAEHAAMFGALPIEQYLFMTLATANGYGGLEHRDSTSLVCKRADLPYPNTDKISKGYRTFLALCSHEYFHLWNVKRIRPQVLAASRLSEEAHTELLWAFEGITSYYDELALVRASVIEPSEYLDMLAPSLTRYFRNHGRHRQSVAESSFDAWTKFYKQDENAPNAIVSYYNKGSFVALGLDHLLRSRSNDRLSLDDLMRALWQRHGVNDTGVPERGIEKLAAELLAESVDDFFQAYVYGTEELPLQQWLGDFGVGLRLRGAVNADDMGAAVEADKQPERASNSLGARTSAADGWLKIDQVLQDGPAMLAGLAAGDLLVALDGERCTAANLAELLNRPLPGQEIEVVYFRRDRLQHTLVTVRAAEADTCDLYLIEEAQLDTATLNRRRDWLSSVRG